MRLNTPRIAPVQDADFTDEQRAMVQDQLEQRPGTLLNIRRTLLNNPAASRAFLAWAGYVLSEANSLPARQREIVILRVGFLCKSGYEFAQHSGLALRVGLTAEEIGKVKAGSGAGWTPAEAALIRAADELVGDHFISDATWAQLRAHFDETQCMDVVFTAGQYTQVSMILNSFGVQLEPGLTLDPDLRAWGGRER
jgi:alkylhydroperoxidase family enzyme